VASPRPFVVVSSAASLDGYIDDASPTRLLLSNAEDFDRVDGVRAGCDAILVGANTIRRDNPRLVVRSEARRAERVRRGLPENPIKATLTRRGKLDPGCRFFTAGDAPKLVFCTADVQPELSRALGSGAEVIPAGSGDVNLPALLAELASRGVRRLLVEGGESVNTRFLREDLVDEVHLAIAPFFVGDERAPRFVSAGMFPRNPTRRMRLASVEAIGDVVFADYLIDRQSADGNAM
jgi:5-amino-6-(5-phosphoribosylamino)uracil reductase